ncbi:MAG: enoyl-CoA hydratase-related protein [Roseicyclus sp.]
MTDFQTLTYSVADGLARIRLNRPDRGNQIDGDFCREIHMVSVDMATRADVRAVLLAAEGRFFSVGGDIRGFLSDRAALPATVFEWTTHIHSAIVRMQRMNAPVVCAVEGDAAGGAVSFMAFADVIYAADDVRFTAGFAGIGFSADTGTTISLSSRMGAARTKRYLLLSETLDANAALEAGLVDVVLPKAEVAAAAEKTALRLAAGPTQAFGTIKRTLASARTSELEAQLEAEAQGLASNSATDDAWEGLSAFAEKRKPVFRGR